MPTDAEVESLYKRADEAFKKHSYDYARDLFQQILLFKPDHEKAHEALKVTLIRKFQEQGATSKFKLIAMKGQFEVQAKATKDPGKRMDMCMKFLNDDPTNGKVRAIWAEALLTLGHNNGAAVEAKMALQDDPGNVVALKTVVQAYSQTDRVKEAQQVLDKAASLLKDDRDLEKLRRDLAARQTMAQGFDAASKDGFRSALKNADKAEELEKMSKLVQTDQDFVNAVEKLEAEMGEAPTDARLPKKIGDLYFEKKKDYVSARDWYKKASQLAPQDSVLRDRVDDCDLKMWDVKVDAAKKANDPQVKELLVGALKARIASFERRVQDRPTDMSLRYDLGLAYLSGSLNDKAIGEFQQSVRDPKRKSLSQFNLGIAFQRKKMYDMAEKQYISAEADVVSQDYRLQIMYYRAKLAAEAGKIPTAIELGNKIIEIDISYKDIAQLVEKWGAGAA
jgi:tetratricopeptide (TPR) repeat protein